jgi:hypothetical protein
VKASLTKSKLQRWLGWSGTMIGRRVPKGTFTAAALAHLQLLLGIEPPELLDVYLDAPVAAASHGYGDIRTGTAGRQQPSSPLAVRDHPAADCDTARSIDPHRASHARR